MCKFGGLLQKESLKLVLGPSTQGAVQEQNEICSVMVQLDFD